MLADPQKAVAYKTHTYVDGELKEIECLDSQGLHHRWSKCPRCGSSNITFKTKRGFDNPYVKCKCLDCKKRYRAEIFGSGMVCVLA